MGRKREAVAVDGEAKAASSTQIPAYQVESWTVDRLKPYERNARLHPKEQIEQLRSSFREFGQVWPILVRGDGTIIAGHGRLEAAKKEKFKEVRVIVASGWSEAQCRAFGLLDNRVPMNSEWDEALLRGELSDLSAAGLDLEQLGFDADEFLALQDFEDSGAPAEDADSSGAGEPAETSSRVRVGPYMIDVAGPMLKGWITTIRQECQDDESKIKLTILRRLGIAA